MKDVYSYYLGNLIQRII